MGPAAHLASIETALSTHPRFGQSALIKSAVEARFQLILDAAFGPGVQGLDHPLVRKSAEDYLRVLGGDDKAAVRELRNVLDLAADAQRTDSYLVVGAGDGPLDEMLASTLSGLLGGASEVTGELSADAGILDSFRRGCELLVELLPELGSGVLGHVGAVAAVRASSAMGSVLAAACGDVLPGTLIFDPDHLANPWEAAGHILHEALHLKLFDISRGGALLAEPETPLRVPWRHQTWDIRRAYVSLHVYAHMILLQAVADARGEAAEYGPRPNGRLAITEGVSPRGGDHETAAGRTRYLAERLLGDLSPCLTGEGRHLLTWLLDAVRPLLDWSLPATAVEPPHEATARPCGRYTRSANLLAKPCAGRLILLDKTNGELHFLNLATWLAFELCDGEPGIEKRYFEMLGGKADLEGSSALLTQALDELSKNRLVSAE